MGFEIFKSYLHNDLIKHYFNTRFQTENSLNYLDIDFDVFTEI